MKLSIIIPALNEEQNLELIYNKIKEILNSIHYEIIFIDDGSQDKTLEFLESIYMNDLEHIKIISFSRNFGKDAAIYAGLKHSIGEYTAIIDADMEQDPKYLLEMLNFLDENSDYDQVAMIIKNRKTNIFKKIGSYLFYKLIDNLSDTPFPNGASDFRMFRSEVKNAVLNLPERVRFSKGIFNWVGFNTKYMEYNVEKRKYGTSKFNLRTSFKYAIDGIIGFSTKPLKLATIFGTIISFIGFIYLIYVLIKTLIMGADTPGFATIVCLILFIGGIQLITIGVLGEYISKMFIETKNRPIYISKKELGFDDEIL